MLQKVVNTWSYTLQCDYTVGSLYILSLQMNSLKIKIVSIQPRLSHNGIQRLYVLSQSLNTPVGLFKAGLRLYKVSRKFEFTSMKEWKLRKQIFG